MVKEEKRLEVDEHVVYCSVLEMEERWDTSSAKRLTLIRKRKGMSI